MGFFIEVLVGGLMAGVLYSLVALGFVLIFKASGVFNFAQGAMVLFAALSFVRLLDILKDTFAPMLLALAITIGIMIVLAIVVERLVLRPLVNQPGISLFMATLGIAYFLDGFGQSIWGSDIYTLDVGMPKDPVLLFESVFEGGVLLSTEDMVAALVAGLLVAVLALFFQRTRIGRALRAVADDHPLNHIWIIVWTVAGLVALVAGIIWGSKLGVQFSLSLIALKALPVLILGGFESVLGAIVGGLIIGAGEKLSEVYLGPYIGGGIENWFAYVLALFFLLFRPQGLFGEKHIDRV
jgi:branched-chain amino acid transport system permease protein